MTTILGIHPGHDAGAALIKNGKILAAVDEERFNRKKHWGGDYPKESVKFVLDYTKTRIEDVELITIPAKNFNKLELIKLGLKYLGYPSIILNRIKKSSNMEIGFPYHASVVENGLQKQFGKRQFQIRGVDHHMAHASSAYYTSGFDDPALITLDGVGGAVSATVNTVKNKKIKRIASTVEPGSLGHFYEALTEGLGFLINNDEYKVMGMASYGNWQKPYKEVLSLAPKLNGLDFKRKAWHIYSKYANNFWNVHLGESAYIKILTDVYGKIDVAAAGQRVLDDLMVKWTKNVVKKTGKKQIGAAGGVFLNVKANKRIREDLNVDLFPFPHAGDGGLNVGSALYWNQIITPETKFERLESVSLGPEFTNEEIESELREHKEIKYEKVKDICKVVAELIKKGGVVGWFQGRMEFGPRALGNRSILANPTKVKYRDKVNSDVKFREEWRPFCPSMLYEAREEFLSNPADSPFMIMSFDVPKNKIKEIEGVVHVDGTTRPQLVKKDIFRLYWTLIKEIENEVGVPVVLNTSFNRKGEPIVCKPEDAMKTFLGSGMEYLAIGDFIVEKKKNKILEV